MKALEIKPQAWPTPHRDFVAGRKPKTSSEHFVESVTDCNGIACDCCTAVDPVSVDVPFSFFRKCIAVAEEGASWRSNDGESVLVATVAFPIAQTMRWVLLEDR